MTTKLGLYCGSRGAGSVRGTPPLVDLLAFEKWLGRPLDHALDFTAGNSWAAIEDPVWWLRGWADAPQQVTISVAMLPGTKDQPGGTLDAGARGEYNAHWTALAQRLVDEGWGDAVLRVGYEFNGDWFPWAAAGRELAFIDYWRQIVTAMRGTPEHPVAPRLRFEWCPSLGRCRMTNPAAAFPGERWTNRIGADVYDSGPESTPEARWATYAGQPYGLVWLAAFAAKHRKHISLAEWGLWNRDEPYFIRQMAAWIGSHDVVSACYFNVTASAEHRLERFPESQAAFREVFGA